MLETLGIANIILSGITIVLIILAISRYSASQRKWGENHK